MKEEYGKFKEFQDYTINEIPELRDKFKDYYMGIIDDYGLESIYKVSEMKLKDFLFYTIYLDLRSESNYQRDATFYFLKLNISVYKRIMDKVNSNDFISAKTIIEKFMNGDPK